MPPKPVDEDGKRFATFLIAAIRYVMGKDASAVGAYASAKAFIDQTEKEFPGFTYTPD